MRKATITLDHDKTYQTIDGFGANINPVGAWDEGRLIPTLDRLVDDLGATIFRLDPYGFTNWVDPQNTADRSVLNAQTYARVYRDQPFRDAWDMARYLNGKGVRLNLNVSGAIPRWMYASDGKTLGDLEAYVELLTSLAHWARNEEGIDFRLFGAFNETDIGLPEGPFIDPQAATRILELLGEHFQRAGLDDIGFVAVDQARYNLDYLPTIAASPCAREKVAIAGLHCYSDFSMTPVRDFIAQNELNWRYWLTEYGDLDQTGEKEWEVAVLSTRRLLHGLLDGVQAALVWDAYDNWHGHDDSWSIYGLLRTASKRRYTPKKRYYAAKQIYRFVPPGATRIEASADDSRLPVAAFQTQDGNLTLVGLHEDNEPLQLDLAGTKQGSADRTLRLFLTSEDENCELSSAFPLGERLRVTIPGRSVFTLTTIEAS